MGLNIRNARVEALIAEVAALTGESKTAVVGRAMEERLARFRLVEPSRRAEDLRRFMEEEIWGTIPSELLGGPLMSKEDEEALLG